MLRCSHLGNIANNVLKKFYSGCTTEKMKVTLIGAGGGIGQPLGLLLKIMPGVAKLALHDISESVLGVGVDLSHINTSTRVTANFGTDVLDAVVCGSHIVIIAAGKSKVSKMSDDDFFNANASIIYEISQSIAKTAPNALVAIITNPVDSMVPIAFETLKCSGVSAEDRIFGVTSLDVSRAATFIGEISDCDPATVKIPVIGGHNERTIIPVLSQCDSLYLSDEEEIKKLTTRIQDASTEVMRAKGYQQSATLSMAFAAAQLTKNLLKGLRGEPASSCAYVKSCLAPTSYFANPISFGPRGVEQNLGTGDLNEYEQELLGNAIPELLESIKKGESYVVQRQSGET